MHGLDWGTVPAWASAVLTGGSLLLGFYILLRDRKKEERADALKIICWHERGEHYVTHVLNASERAIHNVVVHAHTRTAGKRHWGTWKEFPIAGTMRPDTEETFQTEAWDGDVKVVHWAVSFIDSDGASWVRDLKTSRLHQRRTRLNSRAIVAALWRRRRFQRSMIRQVTRW